MKYKIKYSGIDDESSVMNVDELAKVCLELAQEQDFEMVAGEGNEWSRDIENGEKTDYGFFMSEWKENVTDDHKLETCSSILSTFGDTLILVSENFTNNDAFVCHYCGVAWEDNLSKMACPCLDR